MKRVIADGGQRRGGQGSGGAGLTVHGGRKVGCGCHTKGLEERAQGSGLRAKGCLKRVAAAADWRDSCQARVLAAGPNLQSLVGHVVGR